MILRLLVSTLFVSSFITSMALAETPCETAETTQKSETCETTEQPGEDTMYSTIKTWFDEGEDVTFEEIKGFYTGRCYILAGPDTPQNAVLGAYSKKSSDDHGPAFPQGYDEKIISGSWFNAPADYSDHMDGSEIKTNLDTFLDKTGVASYCAETLYVPAPEGHLNSLSLRKKGQYLVTIQTVTKASQTAYHRGKYIGPITVGDIIETCYYWPPEEETNL